MSVAILTSGVAVLWSTFQWVVNDPTDHWLSRFVSACSRFGQWADSRTWL
jgi:hypothetical protein